MTTTIYGREARRPAYPVEARLVVDTPGSGDQKVGAKREEPTAPAM